MDYSNWTLTATPKYTTVKEGINKITAKYSCLPEPRTVNQNTRNAFSPSLPNVNPSIVSEFKHSKILKYLFDSGCKS
jgi:hypothetical protein